MTKPTIRLIITDLDNTLYDWVTYFSRSFSAMVDKAAEILSLPKDQLLDEFKQIHQQYRNSEHPFALLELPSVIQRYGAMSRRERKDLLDPAFYAFNKVRKSELRPYAGVLDTLAEITKGGTKVIGHTEATVPNAIFRLKSLGLIPLLTRLYAVEHTGHPHPIQERESVDETPPEFITLVPVSQRKPNPELLFHICRDMGVAPPETVYIGDSITRDVSMAKEAGVRTAWAKYGTTYNQECWANLVRVTHWTPDDVKREELLREQFGRIQPDLTLTEFSALRESFTFQPSPVVSGAICR